MSRSRKIKKARKLTGVRAANRVIAEVGATYPLDQEDRQRIRNWVEDGYWRYQQPFSEDRATEPFDVYVDEMIVKLRSAYEDEFSGRTISLGPLSAHMLFSICPLWPFC